MFEGKKVEILLNTPIVISLPEGEGGKPRHETVVRVHGHGGDLTEAGFHFEVTQFFNERQQKVAAPHRMLFLPLHKIDHIFEIS